MRKTVTVIHQKTYSFNDTIRYNICLSEEFTESDFDRALRLSGVDKFLSYITDGVDGECGEDGANLSGGQKQRLSIARVFLKNPPILIFDEATSALDNESEKVVQESLEKLAAGRTTFVIAHRLTTIRNAREILVLTENGIRERGTHAELMEKNGLYASLYQVGKV